MCLSTTRSRIYQSHIPSISWMRLSASCGCWHRVELGNEPNTNYQGAYSESQTALGYVELAKSAIAAMSAEDSSLVYSGVAETTFNLADWISLVPMLDNWNDQVFVGAGSLTADIDYANGHYYS